MSRPKSEAREIAVILGDKFYDGEPCRNCGNGRRYTNGGACAACTHSRNEAYRDKTVPDRRRQPRLLTVAEHIEEAARHAAEVTPIHDMLELEEGSSAALEALRKNQTPWD